MRSLFYKPSKVEVEVRRRIRVSVAAYHYEIMVGKDPQAMCVEVMTDHEYDAECLLVDLSRYTTS